jgi:hypothetical protein
MKKDKEHIALDKALIESLGGARELVKLLKWDSNGGLQRINNWKARGIPPAIKIQYPKIFLRKVKK